MTEAEVIAACDPGIRDVVQALRSLGFDTTDSGDGSKAAWMECALDYQHVVFVGRHGREIEWAECLRALDLLAKIREGEEWQVELSSAMSVSEREAGKRANGTCNWRPRLVATIYQLTGSGNREPA